jgi:hypothetical protein
MLIDKKLVNILLKLFTDMINQIIAKMLMSSSIYFLHITQIVQLGEERISKATSIWVFLATVFLSYVPAAIFCRPF